MANTGPQMRAFIATVADGERVDGTDVRALRAHRIDAAYYQTGDTFTTFKDSDNQAVYSVRQDYLISVERLDEPQCDQSDHRGAFTRDDARDRLDLPRLAEPRRKLTGNAEA